MRTHHGVALGEGAEGIRWLSTRFQGSFIFKAGKRGPRKTNPAAAEASQEKKKQRAVRNRESAKRHRERKQAYQNALEDEVRL